MNTRVSELASSRISQTTANVRAFGDAFYNVMAKPYEAAGDGIKNDTAIFQKVVDDANDAGRRAVYCPHGTYYVTALTNDANIVWFGDNATFTGGYSGTINQMGQFGASEAEFNELKADIARHRPITLSTASPTNADGDDGNIWIKYNPYVAPGASNLAIIGALTVGNSLIGSYTFTGSGPEVGSTYKWYRGDTTEWIDSVAIPGATSNIYTLQTADLNKYIFFEVVPKDSNSAGASQRIGNLNNEFVGLSALNVTFSGALDTDLWKPVKFKADGATTQPIATADINSNLLRLRMTAAAGGGSGGIGVFYKRAKVALPYANAESKSYKTTGKFATGTEVTGLSNQIGLTLATSVPSGSEMDGPPSTVLPGGNWSIILTNQSVYLQGLANGVNVNAAFAYVANSDYVIELLFTKKANGNFDVLGKVDGVTIVSALDVAINTTKYLYCTPFSQTSITSERTVTFANLVVT